MAKAKRKSSRTWKPVTHTSRARSKSFALINPTIDKAALAAIHATSPPTAAETLTTRQSTHGDFSENARVMQQTKRVLRSGANWKNYLSDTYPITRPYLTDVQAEAIEMIVVKLGRIVTGDPNHADNWLDIEGYARLARERL